MLSTIFTQIVIVCLVSFGIGTLMEWYKKKVRKDQAGVWEIRGIAFVLSFGVAALFAFTGIAYPVFETLFANMGATLAKILDIVLYGAVIFGLQLQGDMKLIKGLLKLVASKVDFTSIVALLENLKKATGIKPVTIANLLVLFGLTDEKCIEALVAAGIPQEEAVRIMVEVQKALNPNLTKDQVTDAVKAAYEG